MVGQLVAQLDDETFGPGSCNPCSYVYNNPINMTDPSGMIGSMGPAPRGPVRMVPARPLPGTTKNVCCSFDDGATIWSQSVTCNWTKSAAKCCVDRGDGWFRSWRVLGAFEGGCGGAPPADICDRDWDRMDFIDCVACCVSSMYINAYSGAATAASGVAGRRVPKVHIQPGQKPTESVLIRYRIRAKPLIPAGIRPTIHQVQVAGWVARRAFLLAGVAEFGLECACALRCGGK